MEQERLEELLWNERRRTIKDITAPLAKKKKLRISTSAKQKMAPAMARIKGKKFSKALAPWEKTKKTSLKKGLAAGALAAGGVALAARAIKKRRLEKQKQKLAASYDVANDLQESMSLAARKLRDLRNR